MTTHRPPVALKRAGTSHKSRRRGAALEAALLDAAWEELQSVGYADLTMDAVATRADTSRAVLYRRWRNRQDLVIAALRRHRPMLSGEIPDTGDLRDDVLALLRRMSAHLAEIGVETLRGILCDYFSDGETFKETQAYVLHIGAEVMKTILERAAARGEVHRNTNTRIATLPIDLFRHELFNTRTPPDDRVIVEVVDCVFLPLVRL